MEISDLKTGFWVAHGVADHHSQLYSFSHFIPKFLCTTFLNHTNEERRLWNEIFGHLNYNYLHQLNKEDMVTSLPQIKFSNGICQGCILGKHPEKKFDKGKEWRTSSPLHMIHSDFMRPFLKPLIKNYQYVLTFIDNYSHFTWVYFLTLKSQVFQYFKEFKALVENQSGGRINILHSDNGGEYVKKYMQNFFSEAGIKIQHTMPYTPQQNDVAERKNQTLKEMENCMLQSKSLALKLWA